MQGELGLPPVRKEYKTSIRRSATGIEHDLFVVKPVEQRHTLGFIPVKQAAAQIAQDQSAAPICDHTVQRSLAFQQDLEGQTDRVDPNQIADATGADDIDLAIDKFDAVCACENVPGSDLAPLSGLIAVNGPATRIRGPDRAGIIKGKVVEKFCLFRGFDPLEFGSGPAIQNDNTLTPVTKKDPVRGADNAKWSIKPAGPEFLEFTRDQVQAGKIAALFGALRTLIANDCPVAVQRDVNRLRTLHIIGAPDFPGRGLGECGGRQDQCQKSTKYEFHHYLTMPRGNTSRRRRGVLFNSASE